jgi:uncharacterized protein (DUF1778 family)
MPDEESQMTVLGVRVPEDLRSKIREAARLEDRTESSFARYYLSRAADTVLQTATVDDQAQQPVAK